MKLSSFSGIESPQPKPAERVRAEKLAEPKEGFKFRPETSARITLLMEQHDWLAGMSRQIRQGNTEPVPPAERIYPTHLIQVAIDLLRNTDIDWSQVKNEEDLRRLLGI